MKLDWHNNDESFLINGKSINQIIAMLEESRCKKFA